MPLYWDHFVTTMPGQKLTIIMHLMASPGLVCMVMAFIRQPNLRDSNILP